MLGQIDFFKSAFFKRSNFYLLHSMATANLNKNEELVTNTTTASKYPPKWTGISTL